MADASANPADFYYKGRPLGYDPQQAQAEPTPPPQAQPRATSGEQVNGRPAPQPQPQATSGEQVNGLPAPQPQQPRARQDVGGEQVANHTQVHGVPGYYKGRLSNTNTAVAPLSAAATVAPPPAPAPVPAAVVPERKLSWIDKCLKCFTGGRNTR